MPGVADVVISCATIAECSAGRRFVVDVGPVEISRFWTHLPGGAIAAYEGAGDLIDAGSMATDS